MSDPAAVRCTDHPDQRLVRAHLWGAPVNVQADQRRCPSPDHQRWQGLRCARCGGPPTGRRPYASAYCGTRCRVAAFRARQAVTRESRDPSVTAAPGPNAVAKSAAAETVQEVQE